MTTGMCIEESIVGIGGGGGGDNLSSTCLRNRGTCMRKSVEIWFEEEVDASEEKPAWRISGNIP